MQNMANLLGVKYWKLLEMFFFIPSNIVLGVAKLYVFRRKVLGILGDALGRFSHTAFLATLSKLRLLLSVPHLRSVSVSI